MRKNTKWLVNPVTWAVAAGSAAALAAAYGLAGRAWHLLWGATREEARQPMPFDELIPAPNFFSTRAVTIRATPERIWPLLLERALLPEGTEIRHLEEGRVAVYAPPEVEAEATWVVMLVPRSDGATRLITRNRARFAGRASAIARYLVVDPGQFAVERKWLLTVKARAEQQV